MREFEVEENCSQTKQYFEQEKKKNWSSHDMCYQFQSLNFGTFSALAIFLNLLNV